MTEKQRALMNLMSQMLLSIGVTTSLLDPADVRKLADLRHAVEVEARQAEIEQHR